MIDLSEIRWTEKLKVGNEKIDAEHRIFIDLIATLGEAFQNNASDEKISRSLAELVKYAEFHFLSEENLMIDAEYPKANEHKLLHTKILEDFHQVINSYQEKKLGNAQQYLLNNLYLWFIRHTSKEDLDFCSFGVSKELSSTVLLQSSVKPTTLASSPESAPASMDWSG